MNGLHIYIAVAVSLASSTLFGQTTDMAWLLAISEPVGNQSPAQPEVNPKHAATELTVDDLVASLEASAREEGHANTRDAQILRLAHLEEDELSVAEINQLATAYRLRKDYASALHWYAKLTSFSSDPRHEYFYQLVLRKVREAPM